MTGYSDGYRDGFRDASYDAGLETYRTKLLQWRKEGKDMVPVWGQFTDHGTYPPLVNEIVECYCNLSSSITVTVADLLPGQQEIKLSKALGLSEKYKHLLSEEEQEDFWRHLVYEGEVIVIKDDMDEDFVVIDGHHRVTAAILDGAETIEVMEFTRGDECVCEESW